MNDDMVVKWFKKADNDFKTGKDELNSEEPATDTICFHAQQCIEKYLKGFLIFHNAEIQKTHNISIILKSCLSIDNTFSVMYEKNIDSLTPFATTYRYPDDFYMPSLTEAKDAMDKAEFTKKFVREAIKFIPDCLG